MRFRTLVFTITLLGIFAMAVRVSVDTDTWWHLRSGQWIVENQEILRFDPFSLTRQGATWEYPGWLAQIFMYWIFRQFSFAGLNIMTAFFVLLAFVLIWQRMRGPALLIAATLFLAAATSAVYWAARPHIISFALTALVLWVLNRYRENGTRWIWSLPVIMAVWGNIHGGFAIGWILILVFLIGQMVELLWPVILGQVSFRDAWLKEREKIGILGTVGVLSVLAIALNPNGPIMILYPMKTVSIGVLRQYIEEWQSPDFHQPEVLPFLVMLLATIIALSFGRDRVRPTELILVIVFTVMALLAGRNIALFAIVAAGVLVQQADSSLTPLLERLYRRKDLDPRFTRWLNLVLVILVLLLVVIKVRAPLQEEFNQNAVSEMVPTRAAMVLESMPPIGNLFNSYNWGGYIIWALHPYYLSFVDGRTDLFDDEILEEYLLAWTGQVGWERVFEKWDIQVALIESEAPLRQSLLDAGWELEYSDQQAVIMRHPEVDRSK